MASTAAVRPQPDGEPDGEPGGGPERGRADGVTTTPSASAPSDDRPGHADSVRAATGDLAYLTYLRIAAIIGIVIVHITAKVLVAEGLFETPVWYASVIANKGLEWRVSMLVMISGAILLKPFSGQGLFGFYRRRLRRIGIPLVFWHAAYLVMIIGVLGVQLTFPEVVLRLVEGDVYTALYYFWLVLGLYLITPVLRTFIAHSRRSEVVAVAVLAMLAGVGHEVAGSLLRWGGGDGNGQYNVFSLFAPYVGYYLMGYVLRETVLRRWWLVLGTFGVLLLGAQKILHYLYWQDTWAQVLLPPTYRGPVSAVFTVLMFVVAHSWIDRTPLRKPRFSIPARRLANLTLGVFASHLIVLLCWQHVFDLPYGPIGFRTLALLVICTLGGSFGLSWVLSKIPFLRRTV